MAEATPIAAISPPDTEYKPLCFSAVAAIVLAGLFALVTLVLAAIGFIAKRPIDDRWQLIFAFGGFVLAIVARVQIRSSEGTRSGTTLANIAWWLSVVGGGGYFAYLQANETTIRLRSGKFADDFFEVLRQGKTDVAFLLTLDPERRADPSLNPDDPALAEHLDGELAHLYPGFKSHQLIQLFSRYRQDTQAVSQGVKSWEYKGNSTVMEWTYRINSPEGVVLTTIRLVGTKPKGEKGLVWRLDMIGDYNLHFVNPSSFHRVMMDEGLPDASKVLTRWMSHTRPGQKFFAYLGTLPGDQRASLETEWLRAAGASSLRGGSFTPPEMPDFLDFGNKFFHRTGKESMSDEEFAKFQAIWRGGEIRAPGVTRQLAPVSATFRLTKEYAHLVFPIEISLPNSGDIGVGEITLALSNPATQQKLHQLYQTALEKPEQKDDGKAVLGRLSELDWQVISFQSNLMPVQLPQMNAPNQQKRP